MELSLIEASQACKGKIYFPDKQMQKKISGVELDSRKIKPGNLFIATRGERVDGHSFIEAAFQKGCFMTVCEELPREPYGPCVLVQDSFQALKDIAEFYRAKLSIKVVGITGSVGKTSTKEFVAGVLEKKFNVLKTEGNFNNEVGLPLTVLRLREEHEIAVLEMGISHFGEMHRLSKIAKPDVCVMTNIGQCHLEFLGNRDGILRAKSEIFDYMNPAGCICINADDDKLSMISSVEGKIPITFGKKETCDFYADQIQNKGLWGTEFQLHHGQDTKKIVISLPGEHMVYNALAAACVASNFGLTMDQIADGIRDVAAVSGRSNLIRTGSYTLIDDCYNANPVSMKAALELLKMADTRKVAVLGDMYELGETQEQLHEDVGRFGASLSIDCIYCIGKLAKNIYLGAMQEIEENGNQIEIRWFETKEDFLQQEAALLKQGDTVLLKASHGMNFEKIVSTLQQAADS